MRTRLLSIFLFIGSLAVLAMGRAETAGVTAGGRHARSLADSTFTDDIKTDTVLTDTVPTDTVPVDTVPKKKSSTALDDPVAYAAKAVKDSRKVHTKQKGYGI